MFPVAIVRLQGMLSLSTVSLCRTTLIKVLTDQPTALVIDVADLRCDDPIAVTVFRSVGRLAAEWPGTTIMLCGAGGNVAEYLNRRAPRDLELFATPADAAAAAERYVAPRQFRLSCDLDIDTPARAREVAAHAFRRWNLSQAVMEDADVLVSELVTNAVRHARTASTLMLQLTDRYLHVAVRDGSSEPPRTVATGDPLAMNGRGMRIVAMLTTSWGVLPAADGKVVWATLRRAN